MEGRRMDTLQYAIEMELDGEKYYHEQAAASPQQDLKIVFRMLAEDEKNHAVILKSKLEGQPYELHDTGHPPVKNVFDGLTDFKIDIRSSWSRWIYTEWLWKRKDKA
jgi:rubrerythrin